MPYITKEKRKSIDRVLDPIVLDNFDSLDDGELNYIITKICHWFIIDRGLKYCTLVRVMGCLICVMFELYRMVAAPYENKKRMENGPISGLDAKSLEEVR